MSKKKVMFPDSVAVSDVKGWEAAAADAESEPTIEDTKDHTGVRADLEALQETVEELTVEVGEAAQDAQDADSEASEVRADLEALQETVEVLVETVAALDAEPESTPPTRAPVPPPKYVMRNGVLTYP